jgi:uncharacterized protein (DUF2147 family)
MMIGAAFAAAAVFSASASAETLSDLEGTWTWEGFTIEVTACGDTVCAEIVDGPQNVGKEMFLTPPAEDGDGWTAEVMHPATGDTYYARFTIDGDVWAMEGCTASGVCAKGDFIRS